MIIIHNSNKYSYYLEIKLGRLNEDKNTIVHFKLLFEKKSFSLLVMNINNNRDYYVSVNNSK